MYARISKVGDKILLKDPFFCNDLVNEVRKIPGRDWNGRLKVWSFPLHSEQQVRPIVRKFFAIEDEVAGIEYQIRRVKVVGKPAGTMGTVWVGAFQVFNEFGFLDMRKNGMYTILDYKGTPDEKGVEYELTLYLNPDAQWSATRGGDYEFLDLSEEEKNQYASSQAQ